jgi:hypothetical protein
MAHLWIQVESGWSPFPLAADPAGRVDRSAKTSPGSACLAGDYPLGTAALLCSQAEPGRDSWALVAPSNVTLRVNGFPVGSGLRVLRDRDAIQLDDLPVVFYSGEEPAAVQPFPGSPQATFCVRCKTETQPGRPAVRCPGCKSWYHQSDELGCWTIANVCFLCGKATALDGALTWSPEDL